MTARALIVATGALFVIGTAPAMAGENCSYGTHASVPDTVASVEQSRPADAENQASIPYPLPTVDEDTVTAEVAEEGKDTATQ